MSPHPRNQDKSLASAMGLLVAFLLTTPPPAPAASTNPPPTPITTAREVLALPKSALEKGLPVHIQGTVTLLRPEWSLFFVQDATAGVYVFPAGAHIPYAAGDAVSLKGITDIGLMGPIVTAPVLSRLDTHPAPQPRRRTLQELALGQDDAQWVQTESIVQAVSIEPDVCVRLDFGGPLVPVSAVMPALPDGMTPPSPGSLIRVTGVCVVRGDDQHRLESVRVFAARWSDLEVLEAGPPSLFDTPKVSISELKSGPPPSHPVRLHARVIALDGPRIAFIEDGSETIRIELTEPGTIAPGRQAEFCGFANAGPPWRIEHTVHRPATQEPPPAAPPRLEPASGGEEDHAVRLRAMVVNHESREHEDHVSCHAASGAFTAVLDAAGGRLPRLVPGTEVILTGVLTHYDRDGYRAGARVLLPSPSHLQVVQVPRAPEMQGWLAAVAAAGVAAAAAAWAMCLRNRLIQRRAHARESAESFLDPDTREALTAFLKACSQGTPPEPARLTLRLTGSPEAPRIEVRSLPSDSWVPMPPPAWPFSQERPDRSPDSPPPESRPAPDSNRECPR